MEKQIEIDTQIHKYTEKLVEIIGNDKMMAKSIIEKKNGLKSNKQRNCEVKREDMKLREKIKQGKEKNKERGSYQSTLLV